MTDRDSKHYEQLLLKRMKKLLGHMSGHTREVLDTEGAVDYICSVCDLPLKPCMSHPGCLCCLALKGGSELFELEAALDRLRNDEYGICSLCGRPIPKGFLKVHPTTVYCDECGHVTNWGNRSSQRFTRSSHRATK